MDNSSIRKLYRVQGGKFPNRSKKYISVTDGKINFSTANNLYIGDMQHMTYFFGKRSQFNEIDNLEELGLEIIEMSVPYWFPYLLEKYSIDHFHSKSTHDFPKLVDKSVPGSSYQITKNWSELLKRSCLKCKSYKIKSKEDFYSIFSPKDIDEEYSFNKDEDFDELLKNCNITKEDISVIEEIWNEKGKRI